MTFLCKRSFQPNFFGVELYNDTEDAIPRLLGGADIIEAGEQPDGPQEIIHARLVIDCLKQNQVFIPYIAGTTCTNACTVACEQTKQSQKMDRNEKKNDANLTIVLTPPVHQQFQGKSVPSKVK